MSGIIKVERVSLFVCLFIRQFTGSLMQIMIDGKRSPQITIIIGLFMAMGLLWVFLQPGEPPAPATATPTIAATLRPATATLTRSTSTPIPSPTGFINLSDAPATSTPPPRISQSDRLLIAPTSPLPTPTPPNCTVTAAALNLRQGPGTGYPFFATLTQGESLHPLKQIEAGAWILVETPAQQTGWVYGPRLTCQQNPAELPLAGGIAVITAATATPTPPPAPEPTGTLLPPVNQTQWRAEYFNNASLLGAPALIRMEEGDLAFNWFLDSPAPNIPADNFSVRWSRLVDFYGGGDYRFYAEADDGVRVYVDGNIAIDNWNLSQPVTYQGGAHNLTPGWHTVTVEYFESGGYARVKVWGTQMDLEDEKWLGEYFTNTEWQTPALFTRQHDALDFDWGSGSPDGNIPTNFSVRWHRKLFFNEAGDYKFTARVEDEDRVKIFIDGLLLVDQIREESGPVDGYLGRLQPGFHTITVEYADVGKHGGIKFEWRRE